MNYEEFNQLIQQFKKIPEKKVVPFFEIMDAFYDDNLPDGAWQQVLQDTAENFFKQNKIKSLNGYDGFLLYVQVNDLIN